MESLRNESNYTLKYAARIGGMSYVLLIVLGLFAELFVRGTLISTSVQETVTGILTNTFLFRMGFLSDMLMVILDIIVGISFYSLLKRVNKTVALTGLLFRMTQSVLLAVNLMRMHSASVYFEQSVRLSIAEKSVFELLGMNELHMFSQGYFFALIFFGIYLILIALQLRKTNYFKTIFVYLIGLSGFLYVADSLVNFIAPEYKMITGSPISMVIWILSEFAIAISLIGLSFRKKHFE